LEEWRATLISSNELFKIWTDHQNLVYYREPQKLTRKQVGWAAKLQDYDFVICHLSGKTNKIPDGLSRPDGKESNKPKEQVLLPKNVFIQSIVERGRLSEFERVMEVVHNAPTAEHLGYRRMMDALKKRKFDMPDLAKHVKAYMDGCVSCQRTKLCNSAIQAPIKLMPIPEEPFDTVSWDLIGPLPESNRYNAILVVVCMLTKKVRFMATTIELDAEGAARLMADNIFCEEGLLKKVISN
jgi:hypothetical protein